MAVVLKVFPLLSLQPPSDVIPNNNNNNIGQKLDFKINVVKIGFFNKYIKD